MLQTFDLFVTPVVPISGGVGVSVWTLTWNGTDPNLEWHGLKGLKVVDPKLNRKSLIHTETP
jgi:hypothetical protein